MQKPKGHQENIIIETIQPTQPDSNETEEKYFIPLDGKWIIHEDPILIGKNFQTLTNMRYVPGHPEGILGMEKVNTSIINSTYYKTRAAFYFVKYQPTESHTLVQAFNSGGTASAIFDNTTAIPNTGSFSGTQIWVDSVDPITGVPNFGMFSDATGGQICYCNGVDTCIWGGLETRVGAFETTTAVTGNNCITTNPEDFTAQVQNTNTNSDNTCIVNSSRQYILVGSTRPLQGIKFYTTSGTLSSSTLTGTYYNGTTWVSMTLTTNSVTGGISFPTTVGLAQPRYIDSYFLYWYQFYLGSGSATIYHVTIDSPFQPIVDVWDGVQRQVAEFFWYAGGNYGDDTTKVLKQDYIDTDSTTYTDVSTAGGGSSPTNCHFAGFTDQICGLFIEFNQNVFLNVVNPSVLVVEYWNGSSWVAVSNLQDGTSSGNVSLAHSGLISWQQQSILSTEQKTIVNNSDPFYFYRFYMASDAQIGSANYGSVRIDYIAGIPSHKSISSYSFALLAANRLMLGCDTYGYKNSLIISADSQPQVFNGQDSYSILFGDEKPLTCGTSIFAQYASNIYNMALIFKQSETWSLVWTQGTDSMNWTRYLISPSVGCPAPRTLKTVSAAFENNINSVKVIAIWRADDGIYISNGQAPLRVSSDIDSVFDQTKALHVNSSMVSYEASFVDIHNEEYHWLWASGNNTTLDQEFVLDLRTWKWFNVNRGTGNALQFGIEVTDLIGNYYSYGFLDTGYMERLEEGTSFDGSPIICTLTTGDQPLALDSFEETSVTRFDLIALAKNVESIVSFSHTMDGSSTGDTSTLSESTTSRYANVFVDLFSNPAIFHTFSLTTTTSKETKGFEPLSMAVLYRKERMRIR